MIRALKDVKITTQYFDGLGRPLQTVVMQGSLETGNPATDIVGPFVYDAYGRAPFKYMPFAATANDGLFKTNPLPQQNSFMLAQYGIQGETYCLPAEFSINNRSQAMCPMALCVDMWHSPSLGIYVVLNYCELTDINLTVPFEKSAESSEGVLWIRHTQSRAVRHRLESVKFGTLGGEIIL